MALLNPPSDDPVLWSALGLSAAALNSESPPTLLLPPHPSSPSSNPATLWRSAVENSLDAYVAEELNLQSLIHFQGNTLPELQIFEKEILSLASSLQTAEKEALRFREIANLCETRAEEGKNAQAMVGGFMEKVVIDPWLIRHVVDGKVGEKEYESALAELAKKVALFEMQEVRESSAGKELKQVVEDLVQTAVTRVRAYLMERMELLKRPNTNVKIVKENVLWKHSNIVQFIEGHAREVFVEIKREYVETMSRTYFVLFKKYLAGLLAMKMHLPSEFADTRVGTMNESSSAAQTFSGMFSNNSSGESERNVAGKIGAGVGQFALGKRLKVLENVEGPAIVLATAIDNKEKFYFEQIHRSLGKMLSETCVSELVFCEHFFGESEGRMFNTFFRRITGFLLDAVTAHTEPTKDVLGVLLALKVNEAHRSSIQMRKMFDLSDYFIQVDIVLKPKFKRLFDENIASMAEANKIISRSSRKGAGDTSPHIITRRYAEFSASLLAIARFGSRDDSLLEGMRRLRSEYNGFLNTMSSLFTRPKLRCMFLINNIDLILSMCIEHNVTSSEEYGFFAELQEVHTTAFVEHEVADHFPDIISFVRQYERTSKIPPTSSARRPFPSEERVGAVLRQFASNWRLGAQHMQDNALREFPSFEMGVSLIRALFAKLFAYHKRCETAIDTQYPQLKSELVTSTEMAYYLREKSKHLKA